MSTIAPPTPARLGGHPGELDRGDGRVMTWRGELTPTLLSDLMREGSGGPVRMEDVSGAAEPVWIQRCWFDVERGRLVVQLSRRTMIA